MSDRLADSAVEIGRGIRKLRKERNWKQDVLAYEAGLNRSTISMAENGKTNISLYDLERIAIALETSLIGIISAGRGRLNRTDETLRTRIGENYRRFRVGQGLSRGEAALKVDLLPQFLSTVENARRLPTLRSLLRLAASVDCKPSALVDMDRPFSDDCFGAGREPSEIAELFKKMRIDRNMSKEDVARVSGINSRQLERIETGKQLPTLISLFAFCDSLRVSVPLMIDK